MSQVVKLVELNRRTGVITIAWGEPDGSTFAELTASHEGGFVLTIPTNRAGENDIEIVGMLTENGYAIDGQVGDGRKRKLAFSHTDPQSKGQSGTKS